MNQKNISNRPGSVIPLAGLERFAHIIRIWLIVPALVGLGRLVGWTLLRLLFRFENYVLAPVRVYLWSKIDKSQLLTPMSQAVRLEQLRLSPPQLELLRKSSQGRPRVEIGEFDQDGFLLSKVGPIPGIACVSAKDFLPRHRSSLRLVLSGDSVVVEKDFRGAKSSFVREVSALKKLNASGCRVPAILDLDVKRCCLTTPFIRGRVLREELAKAGAVLRDRDVARLPEYAGLSIRSADRKRIEAGRNLIHLVVSKDFIDKLYRSLQDIHAAGVTHRGIKYGNILIEEGSGEPWWIDFGDASPLGPCGKFLFNLLRDYDTEQFNLHFSTNHLTYRLPREKLSFLEPGGAGGTVDGR